MALPAEEALLRENRPPFIADLRLQPSSPEPGDRLAAIVRAEDPDGDPVRFQYRWSIDGKQVAERGAHLLVPNAGRGTRIEVEVVPTDGRSRGESRVAAVVLANRPPEVLSVTLEPGDTAAIGDPISGSVVVQDEDHDELTLRAEWLVNGRFVRSDDGPFDTRSSKRGDRVALRVVASDGWSESPSVTSEPVVIRNSDPEIVSVPPPLSAEGVFRYEVEARDPDGDRGLRFSLAEAPEGASIDPVLGVLTWAPDPNAIGEHWIEIVVEDGNGGEARQRFDLEVRDPQQVARDDGSSLVAERTLAGAVDAGER